MTDLPTFVPLTEAARKYGVAEDRLRILIESGAIRAAAMDGVVLVEEDARSMQYGDAVALPVFLTLSEAAKKYDFPEARLQALIEAGTITAGEINGEVIVNETEIRNRVQRREDLPEYRQYEHLKGVGIGINEAAKTYNVSYTTVRNWVVRGLIGRLGNRGQKVLLDQADVAYCVAIFRQGGSQGRRIFNADGTPYIPKTAPFAE
jgi:hypothetical protein